MNNEPKPKTVAIESATDGKVYFTIEVVSDLTEPRMNMEELKKAILFKDYVYEFCELVENAVVTIRDSLDFGVDVVSEGVIKYLMLRDTELPNFMFEEENVRHAVIDTIVKNAKRVKALQDLIHLVEDGSIKGITLTDEGKELIDMAKNQLSTLTLLHQRLFVALPKFVELLSIKTSGEEG